MCAAVASAGLLAVVACGDTVNINAPPATSAGGQGGGAGGEASVASGGSGLIDPQSCPEGQFATGFDSGGLIECAALDPSRVTRAVGEDCSVFWGWRDDCSGCDRRPKKWGSVNSVSCENGRGEDSTCIEADLGGAKLPLFGLNTNGNVNGDDKFYLGTLCSQLGESGHVGPCKDGEFVKHVSGGVVECVSGDHLYIDYFQTHCSLYLGWLDGCEGCVADPSKWGRMLGTSCQDGAGDDNICYTPFLHGSWVSLFGLNTDGDVDGNDMFYVGMRCDEAELQSAETPGPCPPGMLMTGIKADGSLTCASPAPQMHPAVRDNCSLYLGWRDSCDGCTDPPSKWGRASHGACEIGAGADNACADLTLDGQPVTTLAINTDGNVNGDDKFYVGWQCVEPSSDPPG